MIWFHFVSAVGRGGKMVFGMGVCVGILLLMPRAECGNDDAGKPGVVPATVTTTTKSPATSATPKARISTRESASEAFFETQVRPVLADHCYRCHGPKRQMGGLRVDGRSALLQGGDRGPALVPGDAARSLLVSAVHRRGDVQMPPQQPLDARAIAALETWVNAGAPWPEVEAKKSVHQKSADSPWRQHWAFQPIRPVSIPPLPARTGRDRVAHNPVDHFILAALKSKQLSLSPPADKRTWLRRAYFVTLGLPPTYAEMARFLADPSPHAQEKAIDRLLAAPAYGERWARYWLDIARYADTKGYVFFEEAQYPWAYTYRDYVIEAWNHDLPYNQFVREQLAADLLPNENSAVHPPQSKEKKLRALGFLTVGSRFMNNQQDILDDRIDVVTRGLLGLTVSCARCHDHKFDPIPTADYYSLYGVFASSVESPVPPLYEPPPATPVYSAFAREMVLREERLARFVKTKHGEVVGRARLDVQGYLLAAQRLRGQPTTEDFMLLADGGDLNPRMIVRWQKYLERTARAWHPVFGPWNILASVEDKNFVSAADKLWQDLTKENSSQETAGSGIAKQGRRVNSLLWHVLSAAPPRDRGELAVRYGQLLAAIEQHWREVQRREGAPLALVDPAAEELRQVLYGPTTAPDVPLHPQGDLALLPDRPAQAVLQKLLKEVESWRSTGPGAPPRAMALEDLPTPVEARIFTRGNPNQPGQVVPRQFLGVLSQDNRQPFREGSGRRELAEAIVAPENPLTARVMVNRVWHQVFGSPLVGTPSDFGLRGDTPSHPELLDYLADRFMREGWSVKRLQKLFLLSSTFAQSSRDRPDCQARDPENTWYWRAHRRRVEWEALRDGLLAAAGTLERRLGGPSVDILQPSTARRALYGSLDRLNVPGLLRAFDFPAPDATSPRRDYTTVPQQALFLMNHTLPRQCAIQLLQRKEVSSENDPARKLVSIYRILWQRDPDADENRWALQFLQHSPQAWEALVWALLISNEAMFVD